MRFNWLLTLALVAGITTTTTSAAVAQTLLREGKLQFLLIEELASTDDVISRGVLADLQTDPNFGGSYEQVFDDAFAILDGYTPVARGGYFPENAGIPREQQLTVAEGVYRLYQLESGNELMLYRSPMEGTSRYFIRSPE